MHENRSAALAPRCCTRPNGWSRPDLAWHSAARKARKSCVPHSAGSSAASMREIERPVRPAEAGMEPGRCGGDQRVDGAVNVPRSGRELIVDRHRPADPDDRPAELVTATVPRPSTPRSTVVSKWNDLQ